MIVATAFIRVQVQHSHLASHSHYASCILTSVVLHRFNPLAYGHGLQLLLL